MFLSHCVSHHCVFLLNVPLHCINLCISFKEWILCLSALILYINKQTNINNSIFHNVWPEKVLCNFACLLGLSKWNVSNDRLLDLSTLIQETAIIHSLWLYTIPLYEYTTVYPLFYLWALQFFSLPPLL